MTETLEKVTVGEDGTETRAELTKTELKQRDRDEAAHHATTLRTERDLRLAASDWTQLPDTPLGHDEKAAWARYRQKLRDLPAATKDPAKTRWPTPPGA